MRQIINYVGFQVGWFANVWGAAHGRPWLGPCATVVLIFAHAAARPKPRGELKKIAAIALFGFALETAAQAGGLYVFSGALSFAPWLAPLWIVALWGLLAATYASSLAWLKGRCGLQIVLGAIASPLSFSAALGLGAVRFTVAPLLGFAVLSLIWAVAFPLSFTIAQRIEESA